MVFHRKHLVAIVALAMALVLSACGTNGSGSSPAGQVLQDSFNAMKQLKAVHLDMKFSAGLNFGTTGTTTAQPITINLVGNGDAVMPDKDIVHLDMGQGNNLSEITLGKQVYIQDAKGQWYVLSASTFKGAAQNPFTSMNAANYNTLLNVAQKATLIDHGDQTLNGQSLRHITVVFGKNALKDLLNATGETSKFSAAQQQHLDTLLNNIKLVNPTLDVWIDEATHYVHRMELKFSLSIDTSSLKTGTTSTSSMPSNFSTSVDAILDYSKFNESITISAPANAIPTSTLSPILGGLHY